MRTYLELVQKLHQECDLPGDAPTTVVGHAIGTEPRRLVDWVSDALVEIFKLHPDWRFRRRTATFATVSPVDGIYTQQQCGLSNAKQVGRWILESFRAYVTSGTIKGEYRLIECSYDFWRDVYLFGANRSNYGPPRHVARHPQQNKLCIGPIPQTGYTLVGDYYLAPLADRMTIDDDEPDLPEAADALGVVWKAMLEYGSFEASSDTYQRAFNGYEQFINLLEGEELPTIELATGMGL